MTTMALPSPLRPATPAWFLPASRLGRWAAVLAFGVLACAPMAMAQSESPMPRFVRDRVLRRAGPAVVRIDGVLITPIGGSPVLMPRDYPFFGPFFNRQRNRKGLGAGVVFNEDGLILTTAQTVENADYLEVHFTDGRTRKGTLVGLDPVTDLAVVKVVAPEPLPVAPLGNSDTLKVGQWAIAAGKQPDGSDHAVTLGVIRDLNHNRNPDHPSPTPDPQLDLIRTDAAINHGYSGGPLLNVAGKVVGINTLVLSGAVAYQGFAVPINTARAVAEELTTTGLSRPTMGVSLRPLTPALARKFNRSPDNDSGDQLPERHGVLIVHVWPQGPASRAGLRIGDVVVEAGGNDVTSLAEVFQAMESTGVGGRLRLGIWRQQQKQQVTVVPETVEDQTIRVMRNSVTPLPSPGPY